jgi:hypothetical protein
MSAVNAMSLRRGRRAERQEQRADDVSLIARRNKAFEEGMGPEGMSPKKATTRCAACDLHLSRGKTRSA